MNAGTLILIIADVIALLESRRIVLPDGSFDQSQLDSAQEDIAFAIAIEQLLKARGLAVPALVDQILSVLPLIIGLIGSFGAQASTSAALTAGSPAAAGFLSPSKPTPQFHLTITSLATYLALCADIRQGGGGSSAITAQIARLKADTDPLVAAEVAHP